MGVTALRSNSCYLCKGIRLAVTTQPRTSLGGNIDPSGRAYNLTLLHCISARHPVICSNTLTKLFWGIKPPVLGLWSAQFSGGSANIITPSSATRPSHFLFTKRITGAERSLASSSALLCASAAFFCASMASRCLCIPVALSGILFSVCPMAGDKGRPKANAPTTQLTNINTLRIDLICFPLRAIT